MQRLIFQLCVESREMDGHLSGYCSQNKSCSHSFGICIPIILKTKIHSRDFIRISLSTVIRTRLIRLQYPLLMLWYIQSQFCQLWKHEWVYQYYFLLYNAASLIQKYKYNYSLAQQNCVSAWCDILRSSGVAKGGRGA